MFGRACAPHIIENNEKNIPLHTEDQEDIGTNLLLILEHRKSDGDMLTASLRLDVQKAMQNDVAVFRTEESLSKGYPAFNK